MSIFFDTQAQAAREASARLAAAPKPTLARTEANAAAGALRASLAAQERAAWLVAAIARATEEGQLRVVDVLERDGHARGYLNAIIFSTDTLRRVAEEGDFELVEIVRAPHFTSDGAVRRSDQ